MRYSVSADVETRGDTEELIVTNWSLDEVQTKASSKQSLLFGGGR